MTPPKIATAPQTPAEASQTAMLVDALVEALDAREGKAQEAAASQWDGLRKVVRAKDIIAAVLFFGSLVGGAAVTFRELAAKPTKLETQEAIEQRVVPIEEVLDGQSAKLERMEGKANKLDRAAQQILEEVRYQGDVLECQQARCKSPPKRKPPAVEFGP